VTTTLLTLLPQVDPLPLPAPPWLLWSLLLLTFFLHVLPMNFVLGGSIISVVSWFRSGSDENHRRLAHFMGRLTPTVVAAAITFGVAPLLFVQTLYGRLIFSSAILMAWFWLGVVPLLILAYYGTYLIAFKQDQLGRSAGFVSLLVSLLFLCIGFLYSNNMSMMLRPETFLEAHRADAGGFHLNLADPSLVPRFLHMLLGAIAVAAVVVCFAGVSALAKDREHARWAIRYGALCFFVSTALNFLTGLWWLGMLPREVMLRFAGQSVVATASLTLGALLGLGALIMMTLSINAKEPEKLVKGSAWALALTIVAMLFSRDEVRKGMLGLAGFEVPTWIEPQWGVIAIFAILLVAGLATTIWMAFILLKPREEG
jgi:hypothetical protein